MSGWREFNFFDVLPIRDPNVDDPLFSDPGLLALAPGKETVFYATREGLIREFSKDLRLLRSFRAVESTWAIDFLHVLPGTSLVLAVASKQSEPTSVTLWDVSGLIEEPPKLISTVKVTNGTNTFPLTTFSTAKDASILAFGYADGAVVLVRGDIIHDRGSRERHVYTAPSAITGLHLDSSSQNSLLFVTSLTEIVTLSTSARSLVKKPHKILEQTEGAEYGCTAVTHDELIVAREDKIVRYFTDHRGPALQYESPKRGVYIYKDYVVLVTVWSQANSALDTDTIRLVILDTANNLVAYNGHIAVSIKHIFTQWGRLNIIGSNGLLYALEEKSLEAQIDILAKQQFYQTAINMAKRSGLEKKKLMHLHEQYGDYLQERDDQSGALEHYIASVDLGNTSHVILRYKDAQKIDVLAAYLEAVVEKGVASSQHMALLIVCYTTLDDMVKLGAFLEKAVLEQNFDFQSAIDTCVNAKSYELAEFVAEQWPDPDQVVQIMLRYRGVYKTCLDYILTISVSDATRILIQNSRLLLDKLPVETTAVLINLFTGKFVSKPAATTLSNHGEAHGANGVELDGISRPVLQSYAAFMSYVKSASYFSTNLVEAKPEEEHDGPTYLPPRPRLIFPSFIGHDNEFVIFLEACLEAAPNYQPSKRDLSDIATTMYEMYLQLGSGGDSAAEGWRAKAKTFILERGDLLDRNTAIILSQSSNLQLTPDLLSVLGRSPVETFRTYVEGNEIDAALGVLKLQLDKDSERQITLLAFRLFSSSKALFEAMQPDLDQLMDKAVNEQWISAPQLVTTLSSSPYITIGDVRGFLTRYLEKMKGEISYNEKIEKSYGDEIIEKTAELEKLTLDPTIVQYGNCSLCTMLLELPAVHFACGHSYHQKCLGDVVTCPLDLVKNESIGALKEQQLETANLKSELFAEGLSQSKDKLKYINDMVSRGLLSEDLNLRG